jgi:hypothetical protein
MKPIAFKTNPARMRYRELFRVAGSPGIGFLACALKLFRILGPESDGFGMRGFGDKLDRLDLDAIPRRVIRASDGYRSKLLKLGFVPGFAYSLETFGSQEAHGQVFRHKDGSCAAAISYARCVRGETETETTVFGFNTPLADDTYLMTSGNKRLLNKPKHFLMEYLPDESPKAVFERHLERAEGADAKPRRVKNDVDLERLVLACENDETDFNIERGVYVKMKRSEIELGQELKEEYDQESAPVRRRRRDDDDDD